jgi:hypothetical protein
VSDDTFISRWSRRKIQARRAEPEPAAEPAVATSPPVAPVAVPPEAPAPLPALESLTPESDFTPFLREGVDESVKRQALKTLFQDPRFNVMDGLDVYIDDYSKPDPLPEGWLEKMNQVARLGEYRAPEESAEGAAPAPADATEIPPAEPDAAPLVAEAPVPDDAASPRSEEAEKPGER